MTDWSPDQSHSEMLQQFPSSADNENLQNLILTIIIHIPSYIITQKNSSVTANLKQIQINVGFFEQNPSSSSQIIFQSVFPINRIYPT